MSWRYLLGWLLIVAALASAAAETAARGVVSGSGWFMSAYDVWFTLWPRGLVLLQLGVQEYLSPWLWDPVVVTVLALPAWLLFGLPGGILVWRYHPLRGQAGDIDEDSYYLFDRLDERAREEGEGDDPPRSTMPPPRFPEHRRDGDGAMDDTLPGPFRDLDGPRRDDGGEPPRSR